MRAVGSNPLAFPNTCIETEKRSVEIASFFCASKLRRRSFAYASPTTQLEC